jgi:uncharacterized protein (DUF2235 family)
MAQQPSRIVIYCDGTGQTEYGPTNRFTNISRIKRYIKPKTSDQTRQTGFYIPGIGAEGYLADKLHQANAEGGYLDRSPIS